MITHSFTSRILSVLVLCILSVVALSSAAQMKTAGLIIVKPPTASLVGHPMALLGDGDMPLSIMGLQSSDKTPLLPQVEVVLRKDYHQTTEWKGVSKIHTPSQQ